MGEASALALGAAGLFGLAVALTPLGLRHLPPLAGAAVSIPSATLLLLALAPAFLSSPMGEMRGGMIFVAVGVLFPAAVTLLTFESNRRLGPNVTAALGNLAPVFAVTVAVAVLGEALSLSVAAAILLIVVGAVTLTRRRSGSEDQWARAACLLPLTAAGIRGATQALAKLGLAYWPDPFAAALIGYGVSSMVIVAAARIMAKGRLVRFSLPGILWFAAIGLCNGSAVLCMYGALVRGPVAEVAPLVATYPLATLAFSAVLLRQTRPSLWLVAGVVTTVLGIVILVLP